MSTIKYDAIPHDALIDLKISGHFYEQLKIALMSLCEAQKPEDLLKMFEKFKTPQPAEDSSEHNIHTLLVLIREIEVKAKEQGKTIEKEMVLPEEAKTS
jgi:hypothetical protein